VRYTLGNMNQNLPTFIVLPDYRGIAGGGVKNWQVRLPPPGPALKSSARWAGAEETELHGILFNQASNFQQTFPIGLLDGNRSRPLDATITGSGSPFWSLES